MYMYMYTYNIHIYAYFIITYVHVYVCMPRSRVCAVRIYAYYIIWCVYVYRHASHTVYKHSYLYKFLYIYSLCDTFYNCMSLCIHVYASLECACYAVYAY